MSVQKKIAATLCVACAMGVSSCSHKVPRAFNPPPVIAKAPEPIPPPAELTLPTDVVFEPVAYDLPSQTDPSSRFPQFVVPPRAPRAPVATVPKPTPPQEAPAAAVPKLTQILTPEESRRNNQELEQYADNVRKALARVAGRNLSPELKDAAERARTLLSQAEQAREQDLVTAVNLARRADLLAKDLLERLP